MTFVLEQQIGKCDPIEHSEFVDFIYSMFNGAFGVKIEPTENGVRLLGKNERALHKTVEKMHVHCAPWKLKVDQPQILYTRNPVAEPCMRIFVHVPWWFERRIRLNLLERGTQVTTLCTSTEHRTVYTNSPLSNVMGFDEEALSISAGNATVDMVFSHYMPNEALNSHERGSRE